MLRSILEQKYSKSYTDTIFKTMRETQKEFYSLKNDKIWDENEMIRSFYESLSNANKNLFIEEFLTISKNNNSQSHLTQ
ncbi:hypothetical protein H9M94_01720 [Mycoplasma sp. Pen4]|uniref:hypothetical protein n=1 Tax=Mycoplasma sp. Pen4 TaxID=640330 RepID=UPI001653F37A|nr:hypothetical protein [Mycoplasma sp. Pen4]QNM93331.1 hypothetical protein H9M94_01720 [Mycoplasma sp. Pen4]